MQCHQRAARKRGKQLYRPRGALATRLTHAPSQAPSPSGANALRTGARPGRRGTGVGTEATPFAGAGAMGAPGRDRAGLPGTGRGLRGRRLALLRKGRGSPRAPGRAAPVRRRASSLCASARDVPGGTDGDVALEPPPGCGAEAPCPAHPKTREGFPFKAETAD